MNVIITGATGMVGGCALKYCLERQDVDHIISISRKSCGIKHEKLIEIIHEDFSDFTAASKHFKNQDVCVFCVGVYTGQVSTEEFKKITFDYTKAFADVLKKESPDAVISFLSGGGADEKEKSKMLFAREKGKAENYLKSLNFGAVHIFRPGYIYPVTQRKEPNFSYKLMRYLYKPFFSKFKTLSVTSEHLAAVMVDSAILNKGKVVFENADIIDYNIEK